MFLAAFGVFATAPQTQPKANPAEAARLNNLGAAYMNQQLFEKALKSFQQAAELDPKLTMARLNEGIALLNLQKIDEAKAALEDALKQDPKNPNAWYNLGPAREEYRRRSGRDRRFQARRRARRERRRHLVFSGHSVRAGQSSFRRRSTRSSTRCNSTRCTPRPSSDCRAPTSNRLTSTTPAST